MSDVLQRARLVHNAISVRLENPSTVDIFLRYVHENRDDQGIQGLAFTTNGTFLVVDLIPEENSETPTLMIKEQGFSLSKVFELRLWLTTSWSGLPTAGQVLAREFRWVNDVGAVDVTLTAANDERVASTGWVNNVTCLQHTHGTSNKNAKASDEYSSQPSKDKDPQTTALEFIQEENKYGNMVVIDQLFTGKWS
mgnify:FL=1